MYRKENIVMDREEKIIPGDTKALARLRKVPLGSGTLKKTVVEIRKRRKKQSDILKKLGF